MRKLYKILLCIILINLFVISVLNKQNIRIESWAGNAMGVLVFFLPIQTCLFLVGHDEKFSNRVRICVKIFFWFINICYLLGAVASLI